MHVKERLQLIHFDQVLYHHFEMINEENDHGHRLLIQAYFHERDKNLYRNI
jgi:hypothetical protein